MSKQKKGNKSFLNEGGSSANKKDISVFLTVFGYCILIILLPVFSFFVSKYVLESLFESWSSVTHNIYAAVIAIINLHIALGLYLYKAYSDQDQPRQTVYKQD